jgi:hypothetical protein
VLIQDEASCLWILLVERISAVVDATADGIVAFTSDLIAFHSEPAR